MRVACLGSGSRGNAFLVEANGTRLLVDAGFSGARLARRLAALEVEPESVGAVLVTHEHHDHASGAGVAARRWGWPLHMTPGTARALRPMLRGCETVRSLGAGASVRLGALEVETVATCHDAAEPVALCLRDVARGLRVGVALDLGRATTGVRAALRGCHALVLEANHDERILRAGPYPWHIKRRIGGSRGHLSNRLAGELAAELAGPELSGVLLGHLSRECNDPALARDVVGRSLEEAGFRGVLATAEQDRPSPPWDLRRLAAARETDGQLGLFP